MLHHPDVDLFITLKTYVVEIASLIVFCSFVVKAVLREIIPRKRSQRNQGKKKKNVGRRPRLRSADGSKSDAERRIPNEPLPDSTGSKARL